MQLDAHAKLASDELAVNVKLQLVVSQVYNCLNYRYLNESEITKWLIKIVLKKTIYDNDTQRLNNQLKIK